MDDWKLKVRTVVKLERDPNMLVSLYCVLCLHGVIDRAHARSIGYYTNSGSATQWLITVRLTSDQ